MKKRNALRTFAAFLALLMSLSVFVGCNKDATTPTEPFPETTPEITTVTTKKPRPVGVYGAHTIRAINGTLSNGKTVGYYDKGEKLYFIANAAPGGYKFSHWENAEGEVISTSQRVDITVVGAETYKACYEMYFVPRGEAINTNLSTDWIQGGVSGDDTKLEFTKDLSTRVSFAEPYLLEKGATLTVSLPQIECPGEEKCTGECTLTVGITRLQKNAGSETGDINTDYTMKTKSWGIMSYTASSDDTYLMITVKYNKHGSLDFSLDDPAMQEVSVTVVNASNYRTGKPVASYWYPELDDTVQKVETIRENASSYLSEFFYITDTHWNDNQQYSPALINYLAKELDNPHVVFGGDVIVLHHLNKQDAIDEEINGFYDALTGMVPGTEWLKIFTTLGNHDRNGSSNQPYPSERLTEKEAYQYYLKRQEGWAVTTENDPNHGYYDDPANKVRYIQFYLSDSMYNMKEDSYVADALTWVEEQVLALDEDWTVVLFTHGYSRNGEVSDINLGIKERVLKLKAEAKADIACWITGHIHKDSTEILVSDDGETSIRMITHNSDAYSTKKGNINEQAFSYFQIDPVNKMIYMTRVGAGEDAVYSYGDPIEDDGLGGNPVNKPAS